MQKKQWFIFLAGIVGVWLMTLPTLSQGPQEQKVDAIVFVRVPNRPDGRPGIHYEPFMYHYRDSAHIPGMHVMRLSPPTPEGTLTDLTEDFFAADEPEISWDAKKIIFAGKKTANDTWEVWEMDADGGNKRQITKDAGDVCSPTYLPDGRILFSSIKHTATNPPTFRDEYDRDLARLAHRCNADGSNVEQLTFNVSSDSEFVVMRDGRILFQSWQHHGVRHPSSGASALFTMNPDGTGFLDLYGNHRGSFRWKQREMPDGRIVYVDSVFHNAYGGGWLGVFSPEDPEGTLERITTDVFPRADSPGGRYRDPYPVPDGRLIVSWSPSPVWGQTPQTAQARFGIYWFDFQNKKIGEPIYNDPKYQAMAAIPLVPQEKPRIIPDHGLDYTKKTGTLLCLNAYEGQMDKEAFIKPGQIKKVRIIEGFGIEDTPGRFRSFPPGIGYCSFGSSSNSISNFEQKRIVGEAPVEEDGSFYVEVPADTILHWQTVDENGMALQDALTWAWVRPGENRLCVGCHEDRKRTPPIKTTPMAAAKPPVVLNPAPAERKTVDFRRDIMPIVEAKCVNCHSGADAKGGLNLGGGMELVFHRRGEDDNRSNFNGAFFNAAYENLNRALQGKRWGRYVFPGRARLSPLVWRLMGYDYEHDVKVKTCPPEGSLTAEEKQKFIVWIDLGAQWDNIPGDDPYPTYNAQESGRKRMEVESKLVQPIADGKLAAEVRCLECHGETRIYQCRASTPEEWQGVVARMVAKNPRLFKQGEAELITSYLHSLKQNLGVVREWMVIGPFDNAEGKGRFTAFEPEKEIDFNKTYKGKDSKDVTWQKVSVVNPNGALDLRGRLAQTDYATAYAYAEIESPDERDVELRFSAKDASTLWVNGTKICDKDIPEPPSFDRDVCVVRLKPGKNTLLFKVSNLTGGWNLFARVTEKGESKMKLARGVSDVKIASRLGSGRVAKR